MDFISPSAVSAEDPMIGNSGLTSLTLVVLRRLSFFECRTQDVTQKTQMQISDLTNIEWGWKKSERDISMTVG